MLLAVLSQRLLPDHTACRALIIALRIAMMMVRNKFQSNIFRSPPSQFWSVSMVDTVDHHAGFAINTALSEKIFSLIEKFKKGRDGRRPLSGSRSELPTYPEDAGMDHHARHYQKKAGNCNNAGAG
jgi:hypothetical protein